MDHFDVHRSITSTADPRAICIVPLFMVIAFIALSSKSAYAQDQKPAPSATSELALQNLDRVAAKASDIEAILKNEPGLMVDLKQLVAKQATENGQIVSDSDLTDDALFNRLETDIQFRARATRLLQQYGYLVPKPYPGSTAAQEQTILVQEHLRFMQAKLQAEEQQQVPSQGEKAGSLAAKSNQPQQEEGQPRLQTGTTPPALDWLNAPQPGVAPPAIDTLPLPTRNPNEVLTQASLRTSEQLPSTSSEPSLAWMNSGVSTQNEKTAMASELSERSASPEIEPEANRGGSVETPVQPEMVRESNPYASIPSLFDMYEQVSPRSEKLTRFGMNIFEDGVPRSNLLPTDLPAGPNYVVGPGDGLTIDTWGSVSQRLYRVVDREGRLALPEVGPVLVSGRNLGEVQQQVQQVLRTQYRDIS